MDTDAQTRKEKKKKKKKSSAAMACTSFGAISGESHYEHRIADLKENNKVLSQALESSYKTISLQDRTIMDLQKRVMSQIPELLRVKLQVIVKTLKQLLELCEGASDLISNNNVNHQAPSVSSVEPASANSLPVSNGTDVPPSVASIGVQKNSSKKRKKKTAKKSSDSPKDAESRPSTSRNTGDPGDVTGRSPSPSSAARRRKTRRPLSVRYIPSSDSSSSMSSDTETIPKKKQRQDLPASSSVSPVSIRNSSCSSQSPVLCQTLSENQAENEDFVSSTSAEKPIKNRESTKTSTSPKNQTINRDAKSGRFVIGAKKKSSKTVRFNESEHIKKSKQQDLLRIKLLKKNRKQRAKVIDAIGTETADGPSNQENPVEKLIKCEPESDDCSDNCLLSDMIRQNKSTPEAVDASSTLSGARETREALQVSGMSFVNQPRVVLVDVMKNPESLIDPDVTRYKGSDDRTFEVSECYSLALKTEPVASTSTGYVHGGPAMCRSDDSEDNAVVFGPLGVNGFEEDSSE